MPFPVKLYNMLRGVEADGLNHVVEWCPHGRAFIVHAAKDFVEEILQQYVGYLTLLCLLTSLGCGCWSWLCTSVAGVVAVVAAGKLPV